MNFWQKIICHLIILKYLNTPSYIVKQYQRYEKTCELKKSKNFFMMFDFHSMTATTFKVLNIPVSHFNY